MGILYQNIFPRAVHSLSNGLTIYEMRVTPHDPHFNAVIGGPHSSFRFMAQEIGGVAILFANLSRQLENFKSYGPPQIERALLCKDVQLSEETLKLAHDGIDGNQNLCEVQNIDAAMETTMYTDDSTANCSEALGDCTAIAEDVKTTLSNVTFDPNKSRPDVCDISGLISIRSILNPMLSTFEVNKLYFSSQVAGKLLVFKQEDEGSMVDKNFFKPIRTGAEKLSPAENRINVINEVDPNDIHTQSTSKNVKVDEGYSRLKGYIDEEFMQEYIIKVSETPAVSYQIMVRSDFYNYVVAYFNFKHFGQVIKMKVGKYVRLFLFKKQIDVNIEVKMFLNSEVNSAIDTNLFTPISVPHKDGKNIGGKVSNYLLVEAKMNIYPMMLFMSKCLSLIDYEKVNLDLMTNLNLEEKMKSPENVQIVHFYWKEVILKLSKYSIQYQSLAYVDRILFFQTVKDNCLSISSIPSAEEKVESNAIDVQDVLMEYVNGNVNKYSSTRRANSQILKFCRCDDENRQSYSNEDNISYEAIEADDEIALSSKLYVTGGKFKLCSLSAIAFD